MNDTLNQLHVTEAEGEYVKERKKEATKRKKLK